MESEYSDYLPDAENSINSFRVFGDSLDESNGDSFDNTLLIIGVVGSVLASGIVLGIFFLRKRQKSVSPVEGLNSTKVFPQVKIDKIEVRTSPKFCRYCGTANSADAVFCEKCGKQIS